MSTTEIDALNPRCETASLHVLVVDDDPMSRRLITHFVSSAGHHVSQAGNGREACDMILQTLPDLVICDWDMPELDGVGLCREIRQQQLPQYVYFLMVTGKSGADDLVEGLAAGADDFLSKPVHRAVLLARLEAGSRLLRMERQLRKNSCHDPLTGVLNRRAFQDRFAQEWGRAARYGHPLSCAVLDLDFFKRVNDTHGHAAGDAALVGVASLLTNLCRPSDIVCRCGGEEFSVLLTETNETGAVRWAERIRLALAGTTIPAAGVVLRLTASLGVAERLADTTSPDQLRELADQALAVAKQSGRNRVVRFSSLNEPMLDRPEQLAHPLDSIVARDVMSAPIYCPHQDETVRQAADLFLQLRLTSAPVVNDAGTLVGIVTDADLLTRTALGKGWDDKIRNVMRTDVVCYNEDAPLDQVYQFLARVSVPRIVVVDQGRPTGVISRSTLLRWFRNWAASRLPAEWSAAFARLAGTLWRRVRPRVPAGAWRSSLRRKTTLRQEY